MSQTSKRPGARDISDLKARLGLKKTGSPPAAGAQPPAPGGFPAPGGAPAPGGIVPPPGANAGSIPAPPGLSPAQQQAPVPDASADPFGAMSAMAQQAAAPSQMVVVDDGKPVESVANKNKAASIGKTVAMILAPLIAGVIVGKVASSANQYNQVIADAKPIMEDVKTMRRGLTDLQAALESGKKGGKFLPGDDALTKSLATLVTDTPIKGNDELVYKSALYHLDFQMVAEIYGFYSDIHTLNTMLKEHIRAARVESKILKEGAAKHKSFNPMAYGAVLKIPEADSGDPFVKFRLVQLGGPVCEGETRPNPAGCQGKPMIGFAYREDELGGWKTDKLYPPASETVVETDKVVMLDPTTKTIKQIIQGGEATVAEVAYKKRIEAIEALTTRLLDSGKKIATVLNEKSHEDGKFSFGL